MRQPYLTHRRYHYKTPQKISTVKNLVRMRNRRRRSCKTKKNKKWDDCEILKRDMENFMEFLRISMETSIDVVRKRKYLT